MGRQLDKKILSEAGIEYVEDHMQNAIQGIKSKRAATLAEWLLDSEGILSQEACDDLTGMEKVKLATKQHLVVPERRPDPQKQPRLHRDFMEKYPQLLDCKERIFWADEINRRARSVEPAGEAQWREFILSTICGKFRERPSMAGGSIGIFTSTDRLTSFRIEPARTWEHGRAILRANSALHQASDEKQLEAPRPDLCFSFHAHEAKSDMFDFNSSKLKRNHKTLDDDEIINNFSLQQLRPISTHFRLKGPQGFHASPVVDYSEDLQIIKDPIHAANLTCFPWLICEWKHCGMGDTLFDESLHCRAANGAAVCLTLVGNLAARGQKRPILSEIRPTIAITFEESLTKVWVAYVSEVEENHYRFKMHRVWQGYLDVFIDTLELCSIIEKIHLWATKYLRPWISSCIDHWRWAMRENLEACESFQCLHPGCPSKAPLTAKLEEKLKPAATTVPLVSLQPNVSSRPIKDADAEGPPCSTSEDTKFNVTQDSDRHNRDHRNASTETSQSAKPPEKTKPLLTTSLSRATLVPWRGRFIPVRLPGINAYVNKPFAPPQSTLSTRMNSGVPTNHDRSDKPVFSNLESSPFRESMLAAVPDRQSDQPQVRQTQNQRSELPGFLASLSSSAAVERTIPSLSSRSILKPKSVVSKFTPRTPNPVQESLTPSSQNGTVQAVASARLSQSASLSGTKDSEPRTNVLVLTRSPYETLRNGNEPRVRVKWEAPSARCSCGNVFCSGEYSRAHLQIEAAKSKQTGLEKDGRIKGDKPRERESRAETDVEGVSKANEEGAKHTGQSLPELAQVQNASDEEVTAATSSLDRKSHMGRQTLLKDSEREDAAPSDEVGDGSVKTRKDLEEDSGEEGDIESEEGIQASDRAQTGEDRHGKDEAMAEESDNNDDDDDGGNDDVEEEEEETIGESEEEHTLGFDADDDDEPGNDRDEHSDTERGLKALRLYMEDDSNVEPAPKEEARWFVDENGTVHATKLSW